MLRLVILGNIMIKLSKYLNFIINPFLYLFIIYSLICIICSSKLYKDFKNESCEKCPDGADCENGIISNKEGISIIFVNL